MITQFSRTELLLGAEAIAKLNKSRVAVFGVGGVGGYVVEALARAGIGTLDLIDADVVSLSNINRQIIALHSTIGKSKVEVAALRAKDINPNINININKVFYLPENKEQFEFTSYDYIVDAVDTIAAKISLIEEAYKVGVPVISAMGAGNKLDATAFKVADISKTSVCPLAKVMRRELHHRGINHLKVVYSEEKPLSPATSEENTTKRQTPGSVSFVPPVVGLIMAGEVIKDLLKSNSD